jgi:hypothetical protein
MKKILSARQDSNTFGFALCAIIIGYPAESPTPKDKWKLENVSYNEFGGKAK